MSRNKRLWSSVLLVTIAGGLVGCAPRDVAQLMPEIAVRPEMYQAAQAHSPPADTAAAVAAHVQELAAALRQSGVFQAVPREDGQLSAQFAHPGYVATFWAARYGEDPEKGALAVAAAMVALQPPLSFGHVRNDLYPALINAEQQQQLLAGGMDILTAPLSGTLSLAFAVNSGGAQWLVDKQLAEIWGLKAEELQAMAWQNMWGLTSKGPQFEGEGSRKLIVYNLHDGYDASRSVLTPWLRHLGSELQGRVVLAMPTQDRLLVFGDGDPAFVAEMRKTVANMYREEDHGLSPGLFLLRGDDLVPYPMGLIQQPPISRQLQVGRVPTEAR